MRTPRLPIVLAAALLSLAAPASLLADLEPTKPDSYYLDDGTSGGGGPKPCGLGSRIECGSFVNYKCVSWKLQPTVGPGGVSYTYVCDQSITTTIKFFKDE